MSRIHYWQYIANEDGRPIAGVDIRFYLQGTSTEANIYANPTVGHVTTTSALNVQTNVDGFFQFWVGDEWELNGGYVSTQRFRLTWEKAGIANGEIDNMDIFPPLYTVNTTGTGTVTENARKNKLISNALGKAWNDHVASELPSASPHNIEPVERCVTDATFNKVVSNLWANQIYTAAISASEVTTLDASAADVSLNTVNAWTPSGDLFYADIDPVSGSWGVFNNDYPIVQLVDTSDFTSIVGADVLSLSASAVRIFVADNTITARVTIIG